ncbi:MAG: hypothetical protein ACRCZY_02320 [Phocaeicola sp.]
MAKRSSRVSKDGYERISIWQANVGDIVCYLSSPKVYIVASKSEDSVAIVSATQQFKARYSFDVKRLLCADEVNENTYSQILEHLPTTDKNISYADLLKVRDEYLENGEISRATIESIKPITSLIPKSTKESIDPNTFKYQLPTDWNNDGWFDYVQDKSYRTEKEVETKFILPLLTKLGYTEDDRWDAKIIEGAEGSRKISLEIDFAMYASDVEEIQEQVILIVEAKREFRLANKTELAKAQRQTRSYSIWTGCKFGLVTDSRVIQVLDIMPNLGTHKVLFECQRSELKERFIELYNIAGKESLKSFYQELL